MGPKAEKGRGPTLVEAPHALGPGDLPEAVAEARVEQAAPCGVQALVVEARGDDVEGSHEENDGHRAHDGRCQSVQPAVCREHLEMSKNMICEKICEREGLEWKEVWQISQGIESSLKFNMLSNGPPVSTMPTGMLGPT